MSDEESGPPRVTVRDSAVSEAMIVVPLPGEYPAGRLGSADTQSLCSPGLRWDTRIGTQHDVGKHLQIIRPD